MGDRYPAVLVEGDDLATGAGPVDGEGPGFTAALREEQLRQLRQDRKERKLYGTRIYVLVCVWLGVVVALLFAQGFLGSPETFALADSVLIATATTTTASVTALLVVVARYLFPRS